MIEVRGELTDEEWRSLVESHHGWVTTEGGVRWVQFDNAFDRGDYTRAYLRVVETRQSAREAQRSASSIVARLVARRSIKPFTEGL